MRSETLMEESKLFPLFQERVTCVTFSTEHNNTHLVLDDFSDDEKHSGESRVMTGMGRGAGKYEQTNKT